MTALVVLVACQHYECEPAMQADASASGIETCRSSDGGFAYMNRVEAVACSGDPRTTVPECVPGHGGDCKADADCSDDTACGAHASGFVGCECWSVCESDADCGTHEACVCALEPVAPHAMSPLRSATADPCVPAECRSGADCESGACGAAFSPCGGILGLYCRTKSDKCTGDDDCGSGAVCTSTGHGWACVETDSCE